MGNTNTWSGAQQTTNYRYHPSEIRTAESRQTHLLVVEVRFPWLMMALDGLEMVARWTPCRGYLDNGR